MRHILSGLLLIGVVATAPQCLALESRTTTYTYTDGSNGEPVGLIDTVDGPRTDVSDITDYDYDPQGNLIKITDPLGNITEITNHDAAGRPTEITDVNGDSISLRYHPRGWLTKIIQGGLTTQYQYTHVGQLWRVTQPSGRYITYHYDDAMRLDKITDNEGNYIKYFLDAAGNRVKEQLRDNSQTFLQVVKREYDKYNRMTKLYGNNNTNGWNQAFDYDDNGNLESVLDGYNKETFTDYDALDRPETITDRLNGITSYEYDALGHITKVTDPRGLATTYTVNAFGDVKQVNSPDTGVTTMTYDEAGNMITRTDANGTQLTNAYNASNQLTGTSSSFYGLPLQVLQLDYGSGTSTTSKINNQVSRLSFAERHGFLGFVPLFNTVDSYTYTDRGQPKLTRQHIGNYFNDIEYLYDSNSDLVGMVYPSGRSVNYTLDDNGRIGVIETTYQGLTQVVAEQIVYTPFGSVESYQTGNGITVSRSKDFDGRINTLSASGGAFTYQSKDYTYDKNNNVEDISDTINSALDIEPGYDDMDRLISYFDVGGSRVFGYDLNGNRLTEFGSAILTKQYTVDQDSNQIDGIINGDSYSYDAAGKLIDNGLLTFNYGELGRLVKVEQNNQGIALYDYDAMNRRSIKFVDGKHTRYSYDRNNLLIAETLNPGIPLREYIYLDDMPVAIITHQEEPDSEFVIEATDNNDNDIVIELNLSNESLSIDYTPTGSLSGQVSTPQDGPYSEYWTVSGDLNNQQGMGYSLQTRINLASDTSILLSPLSIDYQICPWNEGQPEYSGLVCGSVEFELEINGVVTTFETDRIFLKLPQGHTNLHYFINDHLNTPQKVITQTGLISWSATYDPFGYAEIDPASTITQPLRFPGQYYDEETGLHYNWHRYYDPKTGRYITSDPIGLAGGINTYTYVMGNPLSFYDFYGLDIGDYPPELPGSKPGGHFPDGTPWVEGPDGGKWTPHPEDKGHWPHWDGPNGQKWPANSNKPWPGQKKPPKPGQSPTNPNDPNADPWVPPPPPEQSEEMCSDNCKKIAGTAVMGGVGYIVYRCGRMVPSLFPHLWWTIPGNLATP